MSEKKTEQAQETPDLTDLPQSLPLLPLRDIVLFPHMASPFLVGRPASVAALQEARNGNGLLFVTAQVRANKQDPSFEDLHEMGVIAKLKQLLPLPDGTRKVLVEGLQRAMLLSVESDGEVRRAKFRLLEAAPEASAKIDALQRRVADLFTEYAQVNRRISDEALASVVSIEDASQLADTIASHLISKVATKQRILDTQSTVKRLAAVSTLLLEELEILRLEEKIEDEVQSSVQRGQKEAYLKERMRAIHKELGHPDEMDSDLEELNLTLESAGLSKEARQVAFKELERLARMPDMSPEASVIRTWLETMAQLPWKKQTHDRINLHAVKEQLDIDHFGLDKVKDRILEYMAVLKLTRSMRGPVLCLVGPPGVGKTSLGASIAKAMGRRFVRVSLGGMHDEAEIRGHRRTYIGAMPGRILQSLRRCGRRNPVFLLDEIDKLGNDFRGDPSSALLEALDPEQNSHFSDHYLEVGFDLSQVLFITTANVLHTVPPALRDRLEVIQLPGYLQHEKMEIARRFLLPKQRTQHGIDEKQLEVTDAAIDRIIQQYTRESGVRSLERELGSLCRKVARHIAEKSEEDLLLRKAARAQASADAKKKGSTTGVKKIAGKKPAAIGIRVDAAEVTEWLSVPPYHEKEVADGAEVGVATGLAWTSAGGEILPIEVTLMRGSGKLILTGQLGDVMKESGRAALSWVRSQSRQLNVRNDIFEKNDIHVHVPEGAIPKDGPSAGLAMATAIASAVSKIPIHRRVAMTGEITLRGKVLPIGGIAAKAVAALRAGVSTVLFPAENEKDIAEFPQHLKDELRLIPVTTMDEVLEHAFAKKPRRRTGAGSGRSAYTH